MKEWKYIPGDYWMICQVCGRKMRAHEHKQRWDGLIVCPEDWESRHSLDFIRTKNERIDVPVSSPRPTDTFISVSYNTIYVDDGYVLGSFPGEEYVVED